MTGLTVALFIVSSPIEATVEILGEFVVSELDCRPGLVHVFTSPYVRECVGFEGSQDPDCSKCVGWILEGV
jgi:hypothetical protein